MIQYEFMKKRDQAQAYAFVDVETTGASATRGRIIDIGIIRIEQGVVTETLNTVVDPETYLPPSIQSLTGITENEIKNAPTFHSIAAQVASLLEGAIFVAHNARFDYSFIKNELERAGIKYNAKCLCTVKLSRRLFPEYKRHDLSTIIERFDFRCDARHRAYPDAAVLVDFLKLCDQKFGKEACEEAYKQVMKRNALPVAISHDLIDALPDTAGVYIFYGEDGDILYVGKSVNIRGRVLSHFSDDHRSGKEMRMSQEIADIEAIETTGELSALLLESHLIKEKQPLYNRLSRYSRELTVVTETTDEHGYLRGMVEKLTDFRSIEPEKILGIFRSMMQAKKALNEYAKEYNLCPVLLGAEKSSRACFFSQIGVCKGACAQREDPLSYNTRMKQAFARKRLKAWPYSGSIMIKEEKNREEGTMFIVDDWRLVASLHYDEGGTKEFLPASYNFDHDAYKILAQHISKSKHIKPISASEIRRIMAPDMAGLSIDL